MIHLATAEEQAIAAINAAEAMAIQNVQLVRQLKALLPKDLRPIAEIAPVLAEQQIGLTARAERAVVRKTSAAARKSRKNLSKALKIANGRLRKKNGELKKGKTQSDVMRLAQRLKKKM